MRTILHLDMNAFFASVEQQANPRLRGRPVAVIGRGRTVVVTASYEARAWGVKTGMTTWQARKQCPGIQFVIADNRKYQEVSTGITAMMLDYTPFVEVFSIDEAWMDVTASRRLFGTGEEIARHLKARIRYRYGLSCSIGIAPNKLLAKLASEMKKPDGLTVIGEDDIPRLLERTPVEDLCGIGKRLAGELLRLGIRSCGDLGRCDVGLLVRRFGVIGRRLSLMGRGVDESPVVPLEEDRGVKSVGHSLTLDRDTASREEMLRWILQLSEMVGCRARRHGVAGRSVHLTVRFDDFTTIGRQRSRRSPTSQSGEIFSDAVAILDSLRIDRPVRMLGVRLSSLVPDGEEPPLFEEERRSRQASAVMDEVNDRYGPFTLTYGTLIDTPEKGSFVISPAWRPEGISRVDVQ